MRVVRFSPQPDAGLGTDPLFGILEEDNQISIISGDPIYHGIQKTAAKVELTKVRLLAPVIPRSKNCCCWQELRRPCSRNGRRSS